MKRIILLFICIFSCEKPNYKVNIPANLKNEQTLTKKSGNNIKDCDYIDKAPKEKIRTMPINIDNKEHEILFHTRWNESDYNEVIAKLERINKNGSSIENTKLAQDILKLITENEVAPESYIGFDQVKLLIRFAINNGANVKLIPLNDSILGFGDKWISYASFLLSYGIDIGTKDENNIDFKEALKILADDYYKKKTVPNPFGGNGIDFYKIENEDLTKEKETKANFIKDYLTKICKSLLDQKQVSPLDNKFIDVLKFYGVNNDELLKELEERINL